MSLGAAFVQRVSGFGFGIFIMTVLPYLMPSYGEATALSGLLAMVTSAIIVVRHWRHIHWRHLLPILFTFLVVSFFAIGILAQTDKSVLKIILGIVLIFASIWFFFFNDKVNLPTTLPTQISMGTLSGLLGGFFGMQGPPAVLYFLAAEKDDKMGYMALAQSYFLFGNICMTGFRAYNGFLTPAVGWGWCYGIVGVLIGTSLGAMVFKRLPITILRKIIYAYMGISGVIAIIS